MGRIPQKQFVDAYGFVTAEYRVKLKYGYSGKPSVTYRFGRDYVMYYDGKKCALFHYGTSIYQCDFKTKKYEIGGWSKSDADAINSMGRITGIGGAYIQNGVLYKDGTGPRYKKK